MEIKILKILNTMSLKFYHKGVETFDKNLQASRDIARGAQRTRIVNTVVGGIVDTIFS